MAESDTTTTPADDGRAHVNPDGTVDTGGADAWVWCTDETGHRFDLPARALPRKGVTVIEGYPLNFKPIAREQKTRLELAGDPAEADHGGDVDAAAQVPPEPVAGGDAQHAAAADVVEAGAPDVEASGDAQHAAGADATDAQRVEVAGDESQAGTPATAKTRKVR